MLATKRKDLLESIDAVIEEEKSAISVAVNAESVDLSEPEVLHEDIDFAGEQDTNLKIKNFKVIRQQERKAADREREEIFLGKQE